LAQRSSRSCWIGQSEHEITADVPAPPEDVRAFYTDLHNIEDVHPLVVSVRVIDRTELADGYRQTYRVKDRVPVGPFALPTRYVARLTVPLTGEVLTEARQFPRVLLAGAVTFELLGSSTRITERITIRAPRPLVGVTTREAVKAHTEMLAGIRRRFGG
jgi:hypothetical protein